MSGLVVPVDVLAYCIGTLDASGPAQAFAGATTDYSSQVTDKRPAFLGVNVARSFDQSPIWPMERGVHLHWAMPDALTRSNTASGSARFPPLPNRWLVSRIVGNGESSKHWIVSSDALSTSSPGTTTIPSVPVIEQGVGYTGTQTRGFRYLGAWQVFDSKWGEARLELSAQIKTLTGYELHAVATGDIAFAAFYPNARSAFGFYDDLSDLKTPTAELMYVVTGWFSSATNDPLNAGFDLTQLKTTFGWTFTSTAGAPLTYSVYSGLVQGVSWDPDRRYLTDDPAPINGDVAIGNHPAETLAAYFRGVNAPKPPIYEELLTLFITGLLPNIVQPAAGQLADLEETLHALQFGGVDAGSIFTITDAKGDVTNLPLAVADALNQLNLEQRASDLAQVQLRQAKWQLFSAWYRLFNVQDDTQNAALAAFSAQLALQQKIQDYATSSAAAASNQQAAVQKMLGTGQQLTKTPAVRFSTPAEPVVLLAGDAAAPAWRYGGDGRYHPAGYLVCRLDTDVLTSVTIAPSTTLTQSQFANLVPAAAGNLPYPAISALIREFALLNTAIGAAASKIAEATLASDLDTWLSTGTGQYYGKPAGVPPSPVEVNRWDGDNPWMSLMMLWEADFHPLFAPGDTSPPTDYAANFFTGNYTIDPDNPRKIAYTPASGGITIDPASINFDVNDPTSGTQLFQGASVLSVTSADNLRDQLAKYLAVYPDDDTLKTVANELSHTDIAMQNLMGWNDALLTRHRSLQLSIGVSPSAPLPFRTATKNVLTQIPDLSLIPPLSPLYNGAFNPLRAGYMKLKLTVMDPFGRKRPVNIGKLHIADSFGTYVGTKLEDGIIYAQPRLVQPSRLLFRWLAADTTEYDEMNIHPATTPVCGWILPNHLSIGFFIYNAAGNPLGTLTLSDDGKRILWQATPGDNGTIDADIETVMQHQNPHLAAVAVALRHTTATWFRAFWEAADSAVTQITPSAPASASSLAVFVGRPLAVVQASLRLERQGIAAFDQTYTALSGGSFIDTDRGLGNVQFPVVVGDLKQLDDGLVGYFKPDDRGDGYDMTTFYTEAATGRDQKVQSPALTNILLTPAAAPETQPDALPTETKLLMLVDPRASVHATMAILPTQTISIPPDQYEDTLAALELTVPAVPLLAPVSGLAIPVPAIAGFNWSWIEEIREQGSVNPSSWMVQPDLGSPTANAVWQYSPQSLTEGWMRLNPELLQFRLADSSGAPTVTAGQTASLVLSITNKRKMPIVFQPASIGDETAPKGGAIFYIHLGSLVDQDKVSLIQPAAAGWNFQALKDTQYGSYWGATAASAPITLAPGSSISVTVANIPVSLQAGVQSRIFFDYYDVTGIDDGIDVAILSVQQPS